MAQPAIDITALGELSVCCMHSLRETEWAFDQLIHKRLDGMDGEVGIDREVVGTYTFCLGDNVSQFSNISI